MLVGVFLVVEKNLAVQIFSFFDGVIDDSWRVFLIKEYFAHMCAVFVEVLGAGADSSKSVCLGIGNAGLAMSRVAAFEVQVLLPVRRFSVYVSYQRTIVNSNEYIKKVYFSVRVGVCKINAGVYLVECLYEFEELVFRMCPNYEYII